MTDVMRDVASLRMLQGMWRRAGETVGLVPTMGALHDGHMALARAAREECGKVIATIFVNPTQFGPTEDLDAYPNTFDSDLHMLREVGVDVVFAPTRDVMYPAGFGTTVKVAGLTAPLCGAARPGHFDGVTQVVAKLLNLGQADRAYFGQKDWQQLAVVRQMVRDLNFPTEIVGIPTVRAEDGLALSSRNAYLTEAEREIAPILYRTIRDAAARVAAGHGATGVCEAAARGLLGKGFTRIDYLECRDATTLAPAETPDPGTARIFVAAQLGGARLIDNVSVG
ncbi:pantothenate synthase [Dinoroseobacter shibae DFL 12 = DSM 16493]|jgi:pantoate--beta-alanine ligase|uniref:Pantothenate synthetase n=1 Tax=Dinoroseobacter shibae (strain DSM 16493 / NCIMB 14021 / DFL 12) TaxID=398580 RepID=PANC_DINSH|nr:pantoate--beta-alanine ligase [Dinoroseobacter shibae]A8LKA2.1 RecName: Full=Pantothenate synthetase; Short=PS; AltName: Full=Pantoate--beta-alanine ligase; AltName: Full=Pantoate-activating enzyme [Dinoroseobacter shibae DFL 12 = DSM 16493]ABV94685.1 pantothenate synthase [Dinoroseobacter shibae DFL 12 = DSM 16493]URF46107.1 pantoate--beta-alanine ligase [Dinoroseobacter shibae]URF50414.1 pantoate--beta-alanine ligase [Dinoroseobacter shibae]